MPEARIIEVNEKNVSEYGFFCVRNKRHPGYERKLRWLEKRFAEGLKIKLLFPPGEEKATGFIEYMPGERSWRPVDALGYMLIHCIFIDRRDSKGKGYGSALVQDCARDAALERMKGIAVVASEGTWMAGPEIFRRNGLEAVDEAPPHFTLLAKRFGRASPPKFRGDWKKRLKNHRGLTLVYSDQCPYSIKFLADIEEFADEKGLSLKTINLKSFEEAQDALCPNGTFTLIWDGRIVADHPISRSRFRNITRKELGLI
jgi:hypothetical protein